MNDANPRPTGRRRSRGGRGRRRDGAGAPAGASDSHTNGDAGPDGPRRTGNLTTVNTLLCGTARFLYGMAQREQMPKFFGGLSKWGTPWIGIVFCGVIIEVVMLTGVATAAEFTTLILGSMVCYCISYIIAHIDVIVLRVRYPRIHRPFKSPLFPIPQILSMGAMVYMIWTVHPDPLIRDAVWLRAGIIMAVIVAWTVGWLLYKKKPLFKPVPLAEMMEEIEEEFAPQEVPVS